MDWTRLFFAFCLSLISCFAHAQGSDTSRLGRVDEIGRQTTDSPSSYVDKLQREFGSRLYFASAEAEKLVKKITIDCKAPDGRYLPLYNALLARLAEGSTPDAWMETSVVNTGKKLQVFDNIRLKSGKELTPQLILEINEWGGYETHSVRSRALSDACFGAYGPIWKL